MFVDKVKITVKAGNGGDGLISFRRERYISKGGPDGGDGGNGGNVIMKASQNIDTLASYRYKKLQKAGDGTRGGQAKKHGKTGKDIILEVPIGTLVYDTDKKLMIDLAENNQIEVIAKGGKGGFGNAHFTSSTRQAPQIAEKGERGEQFELTMELKMVADVGLVGLPNAGKSSLLSVISNARPEIADYPFTTLIPHLGVVDNAGQSILVADIPGLIEGASRGKGLGDDFLRHVSRCCVLLHLIDSTSENITRDYRIIRQELENYSKDLASKPEVIALTKCELIPAKNLDNKLSKLKKAEPKCDILTISSYANQGLDKLLFDLQKSINQQKITKKTTKDSPVVIRLKPSYDEWQVTKNEDTYLVTGLKIEKFAERTDFNNPSGVNRLKDIMRKMGIINTLKKHNIENGSEIIIGDPPKGRLTY
jgi:GTP-binding protein